MAPPEDDTVGDGDVQDAPEKTPAELAQEAGEKTTEGDVDSPKGEETLTPEQVKQFANDPAIQKAVREGIQTPEAPNLDALVAQAFAAADQERVVTEENEKVTATIEEAVKQAKDGSPEALATLAIADFEEAKQQSTLRPQLQAEANQTLANAIAATYSEEIESLSEDDRKALNRSNFQSDQAHLATVMSKLRTVSVSGLQKELGDKNKDAAESEKNQETATKAREDGTIGALPGGKAESGGLQSEDIGALMREGFKDVLSAPEYEE